jgi:hypothetical protein
VLKGQASEEMNFYYSLTLGASCSLVGETRLLGLKAYFWRGYLTRQIVSRKN